jgi:serine/threonine protein kinase
VLDPKQRLTVKEMYEHPFLNCEDIPKFIPVEALTTIPNFKAANRDELGPSLLRAKSGSKLKAEDFTQKKADPVLNSNGSKQQLESMNSPRNAYNNDNLKAKEGEAKPQDPQDKEREEEHKIHVLASVDYSKKYGLGYLINNKQYGIYFNDETLMSTDL